MKPLVGQAQHAYKPIFSRSAVRSGRKPIARVVRKLTPCYAGCTSNRGWTEIRKGTVKLRLFAEILICRGQWKATDAIDRKNTDSERVNDVTEDHI